MMNAITCPTTNELNSLMLGGIPDSQSEWMFEHIQGCSHCLQELESLTGDEDTLMRDLRAAGQETPFAREPGCRSAVVKALASLATSSESAQDSTEYTTRVMGEYELIRPLGHGGMSAVYLARHANLGREVAVKLLAKHRLDDHKFRERFEAEMRAVGKLSHPNIVVAHDAREIDGTAVLITEYIRGLDLRKVVSRVGRLGVPEATEIARRLALALSYISGEGFVHRDVKPSNIMLTQDGDVKLLDLGLARLLEDNGPEITGTGQTLGTADFIAPEQIHDSRTVDARADLYGLGCTLYKLLCGHAPFESSAYGSVVAKLNAHVSAPVPKLPPSSQAIPRKLTRLLESLLAKSPSDRPSNAAAVADALSEFTEGADLKKLADTALSDTRVDALRSDPADNLHRTHHAPVAPAKAATSWWKARTPRYVAIATGFFGLALGLCLGVIITIRYPDGTVAKINAPDGSQISVESTGESTAPQPAGDWFPTNNDRDSTPNDAVLPTIEEYAPLAFSILPAKSMDQKELEKARDYFLSLPRLEAPVEYLVRPEGIWLPADESVEDPSIVVHRGQRYVLVSRQAQDRLRWSQLAGNIQYAQSSSRNVEVGFSTEFAEKLEAFTEAHMDQRLAFIASNRVVSAPTIRGKIGSKALITGDFTSNDFEALFSALNGVALEPTTRLNLPADEVSPAGPGDASAEEFPELPKLNRPAGQQDFPSGTGR